MPLVGNLYDFSTARIMGSKKYLDVDILSLVTYEIIVSVGIPRAQYLVKLNNRFVRWNASMQKEETNK
jgi:hypothetical protein